MSVEDQENLLECLCTALVEKKKELNCACNLIREHTLMYAYWFKNSMVEFNDELKKYTDNNTIQLKNVSKDIMRQHVQDFNENLNQIKQFVQVEISALVRWLTDSQTMYMNYLDIEDIMLPACVESHSCNC